MNWKLCATIALAFLMGGLSASADVVYNSIPDPLPTNVASLSYASSSTTEFGNAVNVTSGSWQLNQISVVLSDWAVQSSFPGVGTSAGFFESLTMNLYNYGPNGTVGSQFATLTINALIPWRPAASGGCANGAFSQGGSCWYGLASIATFNFSSQNINLPNTFIYGLNFNNAASGPYSLVNFGVGAGPTIGSNVNVGGVYINSTSPGSYSDSGANGLGTFRSDPQGWDGYQPEITIGAAPLVVPEPGSLALLASGLFATFTKARKWRAKVACS